MRLGGFGTLPATLGGGMPRAESIYNSLCEARGSAYNTEQDSNVTAEIHAHARALEAFWSGNRRMALQTDPFRMTDMIPRWEAIFDLHPGPNDSLQDRRRALQPKFAALIGPSLFDDVVAAICGASLVDIEYTALADAQARWPENGYPDNWTSNCAHILIRVQYAPNQTNAEFWDMRAKLTQRLGDLLPAYTTFDIATFRPNGATGFYLDEKNLNYEALNA